MLQRLLQQGNTESNIAATKPATSWIEEGKPLTFGYDTFDQILLDAHKLHVAIRCGNANTESVYDSRGILFM